MIFELDLSYFGNIIWGNVCYMHKISSFRGEYTTRYNSDFCVTPQTRPSLSASGRVPNPTPPQHHMHMSCKPHRPHLKLPLTSISRPLKVPSWRHCDTTLGFTSAPDPQLEKPWIFRDVHTMVPEVAIQQPSQVQGQSKVTVRSRKELYIPKSQPPKP